MRVVDLTGPLAADTWRYDESFPAFEAVPVTSFADEGFAVQRITLSTHMGTHADAPGHLIPGGAMIDATPLESFVGWASVIRVGPCQPLDAIDAERVAAAATHLRHGDVALIETGWGTRWGREDYPVEHPFLTADAAEWLIVHGVRCVGMDTAGLMDPRIDLSPDGVDDAPVVDRLLLEAGIPYIAALRSLEQVVEEHPLFVSVPLSLVGLDGAPARAIAVEGLVFGG